MYSVYHIVNCLSVSFYCFYWNLWFVRWWPMPDAWLRCGGSPVDTLGRWVVRQEPEFEAEDAESGKSSQSTWGAGFRPVKIVKLLVVWGDICWMLLDVAGSLLTVIDEFWHFWCDLLLPCQCGFFRLGERRSSAACSSRKQRLAHPGREHPGGVPNYPSVWADLGWQHGTRNVELSLLIRTLKEPACFGNQARLKHSLLMSPSKSWQVSTGWPFHQMTHRKKNRISSCRLQPKSWVLHTTSWNEVAKSFCSNAVSSNNGSGGHRVGSCEMLPPQTVSSGGRTALVCIKPWWSEAENGCLKGWEINI